MKTIILMILGHLVSDYTLQGWLAQAKQIKWWKDNAPDEKYRHDWIAGLVCHSLYWSILTFLPLYRDDGFIPAVMANAYVHAVIDHLKCNRLSINLCEDQLFHLVQIVLTFVAVRVLWG